MTDAELDALEQAARAATPGPWYISGCYGGDYEIASKKHSNVIEVNQYNEYIHSGVQNESDAAYIAAANPATVLELIAELWQARKERDWLAGILAEHCNKQDPSVYEADGSYCHICKAKCQHPFTECENVTPEMWLEKTSQ